MNFKRGNKILIHSLFLFLIVSFFSNAQVKLTKLVRPPSLEKGDIIAIVAPAGVLKDKKLIIDKAKKLVQSWGLKVIYGKHLFVQHNRFAGTDKQRREDFQKALDNPEVKAIWCARGGYGSVRILDGLDFSKFKKHPKWIIGYSDITAIHNQVHNLGIETIHAMMPVNFGESPQDLKESISTLKKSLFGKKLRYNIKSSKYNVAGKARGQLVGGNLTLMMNMLGSKSSISTDGKILFFEEVGEYKYSIDRALQSLKRAGYFNHCKGIIVGNISKIKQGTIPWGQSIEELILSVVSKYNFPVLFDFPAGHKPDNRALILGNIVDLKVGKNSSTLSFD